MDLKGDHNLQDYSCGKLPPIVVIVLVLIQMTAVDSIGIEPICNQLPFLLIMSQRRYESLIY